MRRTIEERAKAHWGTTNIPQFATYLLTDGTMLNGSYEGHQRDIDHRTIKEFMPISRNGKNSGYQCILRFMKRGNIRMSCNDSCCCFEFWKTPTWDQWQTIKSLFRDAEKIELSIYIEKYNPNGSYKTFHDSYDFINWLQDHVSYYLY